MTKCSGCGVELQYDNPSKNGYAKINSNLCNRCFRIKNYNEYLNVDIDSTKFIDILKQINETNSLVVLVVDLINIPNNLSLITKYLKNKLLFVFTKRDLLPLSVNDEKILNYIESFNINYCDKEIVSSKNNYNLDSLYEKINKNKTNNDVYFIGFTNAGKSSLINKIIYNYTDIDFNITTSILPSTTLNTIRIKTNDFNIIDTPGIVDEGNIIDKIDSDKIKKIISKKEIKPITYQLKSNQYLLIDDFVLIKSNSDCNLTIYMSNNLEINRYYKKVTLKNSVTSNYIIQKDNDIVIQGLGFIKIANESNLDISIIKNVNLFIRKSLI